MKGQAKDAKPSSPTARALSPEHGSAPEQMTAPENPDSQFIATEDSLSNFTGLPFRFAWILDVRGRLVSIP